MSELDVTKITAFAHGVAPLIQTYFAQAVAAGAAADVQPLVAAVGHLQELVANGAQGVPGGRVADGGAGDDRLNAMFAAQDAMDEVYSGALASSFALPDDQRRALDDAYDSLTRAESVSEIVEAFRPITLLLTAADVAAFGKLLADAAAEVAARRTAAAAVNATVSAVILAAQVAVKLAAI